MLIAAYAIGITVAATICTDDSLSAVDAMFICCKGKKIVQSSFLPVVSFAKMTVDMTLTITLKRRYAAIHIAIDVPVDRQRKFIITKTDTLATPARNCKPKLRISMPNFALVNPPGLPLIA